MTVVAVDLPDATVELVASHVDVPVRRTTAAAVTSLIGERTLAVMAPAALGSDLARVVHRHAAHVPVLYLADDVEDCEELAAHLQVTPGIDRRTRCLVTDDAVAATVADEVDRSRRRRQHEATLSRVRMGLQDLASAKPETLSRYLGQLFDHAPVGILIVSAAGEVEAANPRTEAVFGAKPEQTVGLQLSALFADDHGPLARDLLTDCVTSGEAAVETLTRRGPTGYPQHIEVTVAPVDADRPSLGTIVLVHDETARVHAVQLAEQARLQAEHAAERYLQLAWTLQESLLPPELPQVGGVALAARYHPAGDGTEIGGDFYDVFELDDDEWLAVIGDVCGKGVGAARLTALTRYTLRAIAPRWQELERSFTELNTVLRRQYELDRPRGEHRFATVAMARLRRNADGMALRCGSGGHPAPLVVRGDGGVEEVPCRGPLLGMFDDVGFVTSGVQLARGDLVVMHTDGVTEARRGREQFGDDRLRDVLRSHAGGSADEVADGVLAAVLDFQGQRAADDTAIFVVGAQQT